MAATKPVVLRLLRSIVGIPGILCAQRRSPGGALGDAGVADFNRCTATGVDDPPTPQREEQGGETSGPGQQADGETGRSPPRHAPWRPVQHEHPDPVRLPDNPLQ